MTKLIGPGASQIPVNGMLGTMAYQDAKAVNILGGAIRALSVTSLTDYADDAAAATGGVAVGGLYRTGSILKIRVA